MTLQSSEYDISYFDRVKARNQSLPEHPAGYSRYENIYPWYEHLYTPLMDRLKPNQYVGKKTLEIACAKGYIVEEWRKLGIDAWGIDISQYAIDEASEEVKPAFIRRRHVRTETDQRQHKWQVLVGE